MFGNFTSGPNAFFAILLGRLNLDDGEKLYYDSYDVYVNNEYVGRKTLVAQNESVKDIDNHLKLEGFRNFNSDINGNQVLISSGSEEAADIKRNLSVYLRIR